MQIFPRSLNKLPLVAGLAATLGLVGVTFVIWYYFSPWFTQVGYTPKQPVPYSHRLHAGQLGLDCRYCHVNVERAPLAMVPPTETCMNCHQLVRTDSKMLQPIRDSWESGKPMEWVRIHKLPDYVYFDHSVHVTAGVGCVECHGRIDQMEQVRMEKPLSMGWCLECHRDVKEKQGDSERIRPVAQMTNMAYVHDGHVETPRHLDPPENCWGCHR
jgi:cytochrome c7-like protein